jgi:hypothetical protein
MWEGNEAVSCASALVVVTSGHEVPHSAPERLKGALSNDDAGKVQPRHKPRLLGFSESGSRIGRVAYELRVSGSNHIRETTGALVLGKDRLEHFQRCA